MENRIGVGHKGTFFQKEETKLRIEKTVAITATSELTRQAYHQSKLVFSFTEDSAKQEEQKTAELVAYPLQP